MNANSFASLLAVHQKSNSKTASLGQLKLA